MISQNEIDYLYNLKDKNISLKDIGEILGVLTEDNRESRREVRYGSPDYDYLEGQESLLFSILSRIRSREERNNFPS